MTRASIDFVSPFFIAGDVERSLAFYRDQLGFTVVFQETEPPHQTPFFAIVSRDGAMLLLKGSGAALPNPTRYSWARWDAYFFVPDPDALAAEFEGRGVSFSAGLKDTHDGLRGFELMDPDGYVLFFGRPAPRMSASGQILPAALEVRTSAAAASVM
jgi:catechol 2,3-dioxygenase-like lactoylglutathione lyase family enzyme